MQGILRARTLAFWLVLSTGLALVLVACSITADNSSLVDSIGSAGSPGQALREADDFNLELFGGGEVTLAELRGKVVVLNFWASWCPPCRDEAPIFEKVWRSYRDRGVVFVGVDVQDDEGEARAFVKQYGITYANGPDSSKQIAEAYVVSNIPTTVFITRDGKIARKWVGPMSEKQLVALVESLIK